MPATLVQSKSAAQNTGLATVTVTWDTPAAAGNLLVVVIASDDYRTAGGVPTGFTEPTGGEQKTFHGLYFWYKFAAGGETSTTYTIASASTSVWETYEWSGIGSFDISAGLFAQTGATTYTTPNLTPTAGERLLLGVLGGSTSAANFTSLGSWTNSFTGQLFVTNTKASGTRDIVGLASRAVTADGATVYSAGATYAPTATARTGFIGAFKVAAGGGATTHAGAGSGSSVSGGSAAVTLSLAAAASGASTSGGSAAAGRLMAAATTGASASSGSAAATIATGPVTHQAAASGASASTGTAAATVVPPGPVTYQAGASGSSTSGGSAALVLRMTVAASGASVSAGSAIPGWLLAAAASGASTSSGLAVAAVLGQVVTRPNTGTTGRPAAGTTGRPYSGTATRP